MLLELTKEKKACGSLHRPSIIKIKVPNVHLLHSPQTAPPTTPHMTHTLVHWQFRYLSCGLYELMMEPAIARVLALSLTAPRLTESLGKISFCTSACTSSLGRVGKHPESSTQPGATEQPSSFLKTTGTIVI